MRILIAESKTMNACDRPVSKDDLRSARPMFEARADELMLSWSNLSVSEIADAIRISSSLATEMKNMIAMFPDKNTGSQAIEAFTGVVFKALDFATLSADAAETLNCETRIISSLYGILRPKDIIKAYRLDFNTPLAPGRQRMSGYWRPLVTEALVSDLSITGTTEILDLLPSEGAKCIDWKEVGHHARVRKVVFRTADPNGRISTPHASFLKTLRGQLLRQICEENIGSFAELSALVGDVDSTDSDQITVTI